LKVLILYETTHGATKVCAEKLAEALHGQADVFRARHFTGDLSNYDCVIVGSPIYGSSAAKQITGFCSVNCEQLAKKSFAVFFSCLSEDRQEIDKYLRQNFPQKLVETAIAYESFGGAFYFSRLNFLDRFIDKILVKAYAKSAGIAVPDGKTDFVTISEEKIKAFAEKIEGAAVPHS
jgi:menaquinone-dependent protoporphyrinogen oxidase